MIKRLIAFLIISFAISVSNISFAQNTDYVTEFGYTMTTVRSFAGRSDYSPGFFMRYGSTCTPEV